MSFGNIHNRYVWMFRQRSYHLKKKYIYTMQTRIQWHIHQCTFYFSWNCFMFMFVLEMHGKNLNTFCLLLFEIIYNCVCVCEWALKKIKYTQKYRLMNFHLPFIFVQSRVSSVIYQQKEATIINDNNWKDFCSLKYLRSLEIQGLSYFSMA